MKSRICSSTLLLLWGLCQCTDAQSCENGKIQKKLKDKVFPDLFQEGKLSYLLSVEYTIPNSKQTNIYHEDYDISNKKGMIESISNGKTTYYYYNFETLEAHYVSGRECTLYNVSDIPDFMGDFPEEWLYTNNTGHNIRGPSAMFEYGLVASENNPSSVAYMGLSDSLVRGLQAQYWRRCRQDGLVFDYYFTTDDHEDAYGFADLKRIPLRVTISGAAKGYSQEMLPQQYEIFFFQPFISDLISVLELPQGYGCKRGPLVDAPDLPTLDGKNLFVYGDAIYSDRSESDEIWSYSSTFMFALDLSSSHMAYYFTPWGDKKGNKQSPGAPEYIVYDTKNKYLYARNFSTGQCEISRQKHFMPAYQMPNDGGHVDLTDPAVLFTNNELQYLGEGVDRGLSVHIFEGVFEQYPLGNRVVPKAIVTHYYLKDNEVTRNAVAVKNSLTRISMVFLDTSKEKPYEGRLTFNFYGFSTQVPHKKEIFNIMGCVKNEDESLWMTIGFPADENTKDKIKSEVPSIEENVMGQLTQNTDLSPIRVPVILVDFADLIYVTVLVLDKPPVMLDYLEAEDGFTITGTTDSEGIISLLGCANECLESEDLCWAIGFCDASCYFATGTKAEVTKKSGCQVYRRYNNETFIKSKETLSETVKKMVEENRFKLIVPTGDDAPIELEANYIEITSPGEDDALFDLMGNELNPHLRVVKVGAKLTTGDKVKNLGRLRYDECQRVCVDFKICQTISYCVSNSECIVSTADPEDIPKDKIADNNFCNLLTRKYADQFERTPGNTLSQTAKKNLNLPNVEDCAKACARETDFKCLSFDHCPSTSKKDGCRLHAVHITDIKTKETEVSKVPVCGHYSRKFSYDFKKETEKKTVGSGFIASKNVTMEQCARSCIEYGGGSCYGFDFCQDKTLLGSTCTLLDKHPSLIDTSYSAICNHFTRDLSMAPSKYSSGTAAGIGILCFVIGGVLGAAILFLVMYIKMNRSR